MPAHSFSLIDYVRFAQLTAPQKAAARALYHKTRELTRSLWQELKADDEMPLPAPLLDCWFLPEGDEVSTHGFFERDPLAPSPITFEFGQSNHGRSYSA